MYRLLLIVILGLNTTACDTDPDSAAKPVVGGTCSVDTDCAEGSYCTEDSQICDIDLDLEAVDDGSCEPLNSRLCMGDACDCPHAPPREYTPSCVDGAWVCPLDRGLFTDCAEYGPDLPPGCFLDGDAQ